MFESDSIFNSSGFEVFCQFLLKNGKLQIIEFTDVVLGNGCLTALIELKFRITSIKLQVGCAPEKNVIVCFIYKIFLESGVGVERYGEN